jgi:hypothetical protein
MLPRKEKRENHLTTKHPLKYSTRIDQTLLHFKFELAKYPPAYRDPDHGKGFLGIRLKVTNTVAPWKPCHLYSTTSSNGKITRLRSVSMTL